MGDPQDDERARWLPPTPQDQPAFGSGPAPTQSSGKATTSLVCGIVGLLLCPWVLSVLALVYGYKARKQIDGAAGRYGNRGVATAGIVLGWVGIFYAVGATIYLIDKINTPDDDGNGVPDGIDNAAISSVLMTGTRLLGLALF